MFSLYIDIGVVVASLCKVLLKGRMRTRLGYRVQGKVVDEKIVIGCKERTSNSSYNRKGVL